MTEETKRPTKNECLLAHCHTCMERYIGGKDDCRVTDCELYTYMPYRDKRQEPDLEWTKWNPKRIGYVTHEESKRGVVLTEEQKTEITARMESLVKKEMFDCTEADPLIEILDKSPRDDKKAAELLFRSEDDADQMYGEKEDVAIDDEDVLNVFGMPEEDVTTDEIDW